jgi:hypothetical protein
MKHEKTIQPAYRLLNVSECERVVFVRNGSGQFEVLFQVLTAATVKIWSREWLVAGNSGSRNQLNVNPWKRMAGLLLLADCAPIY